MFRLEAFIRRLINLSWLIVLTRACRTATVQTEIPQQWNPAAAEKPSGPYWIIDPSQSNIGIFVLDFRALEIKSVDFRRLVPCGDDDPPVGIERSSRRAQGLFEAVGDYWPRRLLEEGNEDSWTLFTDVTPVEDLVVLEIEPGDFGGFAVSYRCNGLVLYAGSIVWAGRGERIYPVESIPVEALDRSPGPISPPNSFTIMFHTDAVSDPEEAELAWESIQGLDLVQELTNAPFNVLVYLYPQSVGLFQGGICLLGDFCRAFTG